MSGALVTALAPPGPAWSAVLTTWRTTWPAEVVATALAALYLRTVLHVGGWPVLRTVSAMGALALVVVAVDSGIGVAAPRSFPVGVVMQLLLGIVVPALWVAGRPLELLRRGSSPRVVSVLDRVRAGVVGRAFTSLVALVVFALTVALTRLTAFPELVAVSPAWQVGAPLVWVVAGLLFFHATLSPGRSSPALRVLLLVVATGVVGAVGAVLAARDPAPGFPVDDVHLGGTIMWAGGGGLMLVIVVASVSRWMTRRPGSVRTEVR